MILIFPFDKGSISIICRKTLLLRLSFWGYALGAFILLTSCNSKKYLSEDQSFLFKNKITIKSKHKISDVSGLKENLATLYRQTQTKYVVPGIPRHVLYYQYLENLKKNPNHKKWTDEKLIKNKPAILDSVKTIQTTTDFEKYLNLRGYRYALATFKIQTSDKKSIVTYHVDPGPRTLVDSFVIVASDTALIHLIQSDNKNSFFTPRSPLDIEIYNKERARIVNLFQNNGYYTFDETYISPLEVDTSSVRVKATMRVLNESDSTLHKKFYVGKVSVFPDYHFSDTLVMRDTTIRNIRYVTPTKELTLKPEVIERNLFVHEGDLNRKQNLVQSIRNLGKIELIKFVTPTIEMDTISSDTPHINYTMFLSRNKKIPIVASVELTNSIIANKSRSLLGAAASLNYRDRNLFKGAEVLNLNYETGVEFNYLTHNETADHNILNNLNIGTGASLSFPKFIDPLRFYNGLANTKSIDPTEIKGHKLGKWLLYDATSRLNLSYNYVFIQDLYKYNAFNLGLNYDIIPDPFHKLSIEHIGIDLFVPEAAPAFQNTVLDQSTFQQESFSKQLYTGLLFKSILYDFNSGSKKKRALFRFIGNTEISGLEVLGINELTNLITHTSNGYYLGKNDGLPGDTTTFSHYAKAEIDLRYLYSLNSHTKLGFRFNTGIASPFGEFTKQVPYPKQFWVGGAQSIRAWQVRELGPGAYVDPNYFPQTKKDSITAFYETGDFKIDMSAELRFPLFWYFNGALFLDAANVWTLKNDTSREGENLTGDFYKQFGIGYGWGIRMDFNYFILRLDFGYKLYNPYKVNGSHILTEELKKFPGGAQLQLAVGLNFD